MLYVIFFMSVLALGLCLPWEGNIHKENEQCRCPEIEHIQKQNEELRQAVNDMQGMLKKHIETTDRRIERLTTSLQR